MENSVLLQDAATVAVFIAPGYFALATYAAIYAKREKNFSRLLVESVALSLPLVAIANWLWELLAGEVPVRISAAYVLLLLCISILVGVLFSLLRVRWPIRQAVERFGLNMPDEDFIRFQFSRLPKKATVTIKLKNGQIFSGTPQQGSTYAHGTNQRYYFDDVSWYDKATGKWNPRPGGIIINLNDVEHIETPSS